MSIFEKEEISLPGALVGLIVRPGHAVESLFAEQRVRHLASMALLIWMLLALPAIAHFASFRFNVYRPEAVFVSGLVASLTLALFVPLLYTYLRIASLPVSILQVMGMVVYALVPMTLFVSALYLLNFALLGNTALLARVIAGKSVHQHFVVRLIPLVFVLSNYYVIRVFVSAMRVLCSLPVTAALLTGFFALAPLYLAFFLSIVLTDAAVPGAGLVMKNLLISPATALNFEAEI